MTYLWVCRGCGIVAQTNDRDERLMCDIKSCERVGEELGRDWKAENVSIGAGVRNG